MERIPRPSDRVLWYLGGESGSDLYVCADFSFDVIRPLSNDLRVLLEACDGERNLDEIARKLGLGEAAKQTIEKLSEEYPRFFTWKNGRTAAQIARSHVLQMLRQHQAAHGDETDNHDYHRSEISDGMQQFDAIETTVSHVFREPHAALQGRTYGGAFCDTVLPRLKTDGELNILEIGGGTGWLARCFLDRLRVLEPDVYRNTQYRIFDLSPALQSSQREVTSPHADRITLESGDIQEQAPAGQPYDLIISNEVIADLRLGWVRNGIPSDPVTARILDAHDLNLYPIKGSACINLEAIRLVERIPSWLQPGGLAVLTEYGHRDRASASVPLGRHRETSIQFDHLLQVASRHVQDASLVPLADFLGIQSDYPVVSGTSMRLLNRHLLPALGREPLPILNYSFEMLKAQIPDLIPRIRNLHLATVEEGGTMTVKQFQALVLAKDL